jgi:hypothetical protein
MTSRFQRIFSLLIVLYTGNFQYELLCPHYRSEYRIAKVGFLGALLALLGGGTTSDWSHVGVVVLLAGWTRPTLGKDEAVSVLLLVPIERALFQSGNSTAPFARTITLSSKLTSILIRECTSAQPNKGHYSLVHGERKCSLAFCV